MAGKSIGVAAAMLMAGTIAAAQAPRAGAPGSQSPIGVTNGGTFQPLSSNVKVFGGVVNAESCSFDAARDLIVLPNRGADQRLIPGDGFVSLLNPDGSLHTPRWIGGTRDGPTINQPFGSDIRNGKLYLADSDGDTADGTPRTAVIRQFDMATGAPAGEIRVPGAIWFNDIAVAGDGTIYASQTGSPDGKTPMRLYRIAADGKASILIEGGPLVLPNGVAIDNAGNVVVVNVGNAAVMTFSPDGRLLLTEQAAQYGSDGIVIMPDGTKYVSSVRLGGISRMRPNKPAELIASGIVGAASMCLDPKRRRLIIPMNSSNAVAFVKL